MYNAMLVSFQGPPNTNKNNHPTPTNQQSGPVSSGDQTQVHSHILAFALLSAFAALLLLKAIHIAQPVIKLPQINQHAGCSPAQQQVLQETPQALGATAAAAVGPQGGEGDHDACKHAAGHVQVKAYLKAAAAAGQWQQDSNSAAHKPHMGIHK
jgi:hypothetical protein